MRCRERGLPIRARIFRDGMAKPILAEETPSFHFTTARSSHVQADESSYDEFLCESQSLHQQVQSTAHRDVDHGILEFRL